MAIEFNCSYCSALIRVPDNAGGGKGRCPKCARRITVPKVSTVKPVAPPPVTAPVVSPPVVEEPVEPERPREIENFFDPDYDPRKASAAARGQTVAASSEPEGFPAAFPQSHAAPSMAAKIKNQSRGGAWLVPLGFGLILCGIGGWFYWQQIQGERLGGELIAETADQLELIPALVEKASIKQPSDDVDAVLIDLEKSPVPLLSSLMQVQLSGSGKGVLVYLNAGPQARFYRVDVSRNEPLVKYQAKHVADLEQQRMKELQQAATAFAVAYRKVIAKQADQSSLTGFRNTLALPALVRGLGHQIVATHGRTIYPCVYEDHEGGLYFLLPPDVKEFEITGRTYENGAVVFPASYKVKVAGLMKVAPKKDGDAAGTPKSGSPKKGPVFKRSDESEAMADPKEDAAMKKDE